MRTGERVRSLLESPRRALLILLGGSGFLVLAWTLRGLTVARNPVLYGQLQFASGLLAIILALAVLVRFLGTRGRLPLILACGFVIVGITLVGSSLFSILVSEFDLRDPMTWVIGRTLLALLLIAALVVEQRFPTTRNHYREIIMALAVVILSTWFLSITHRRLPANLIVHPGGIFPASRKPISGGTLSSCGDRFPATPDAENLLVRSFPLLCSGIECGVQSRCRSVCA